MWLYVNTIHGEKHLINVDNIADIKYEEETNQTVIMCLSLDGVIRISGNQIPNIKIYILERAENANCHTVCKIGYFNE